MKTMKYRSVYSTLCAAALSVFLFTACEKESDNAGSTDGDRLDKFKRLEFTGSGSGASGSTSSSSGSGTFIGGGSNVSFVPPSETGSSSQFAPSVAGSGEFTDPMSTGPTFAVATPFNVGGGTFTLGGESYELDFGFCASSDIFGDLSGPSAEEGDLEIFIGVAGDFDFSMAGEDEPDDLGIEMILYAFSYNGSNRIGDFLAFEGQEGDFSNSAFVIAITFEPGADEDATLYFARSGSVDFSGGSVSLSGLRMAKVFEGIDENVLESGSVNAGGFLECGSIVFDEEEEF